MLNFRAKTSQARTTFEIESGLSKAKNNAWIQSTYTPIYNQCESAPKHFSPIKFAKKIISTYHTLSTFFF